MAHETFAPWGEVVPGVGPMTAADALDGLNVVPGFAYSLADLFS